MSDFEIDAFVVRQPAGTFYLAAVPAEKLLTICEPLEKPTDSGLFSRDRQHPVALSRRQVDALVESLKAPSFASLGYSLLSEGAEQPYQRFLDRRRAREIAEYFRQPTALLPNGIILAINLTLEEADVLKVVDEQRIRIILPAHRTTATILDGQHRVAAFECMSEAERSGFTVPVSFLVGVPFYQQAELFAVINGKQKRVNKSIIFDLFGYAPLESEQEAKLYEGLMAVARFCSHVTRLLNQVEQSPWQNQIKMRGPGDVGAISQAAVVEYLAGLVEPKSYSSRLRILPLLYPFFREADAPRCAALLIMYLLAIQSAQPVAWGDRGSLLWKNNGVAIIMRFLHDHIILAGGVEPVMKNFSPVIEAWKRAPAELMIAPKSGGGGVQNERYEQMAAAMFTAEEAGRLLTARARLEESLLESGGLVR